MEHAVNFPYGSLDQERTAEALEREGSNAPAGTRETKHARGGRIVTGGRRRFSIMHESGTTS